MNKCKLSICLLLLVPLLGSWKSSGTISVKLHAFTEYYVLPDKTTVKSGAGHSFIQVFNNTSSTIRVGYYYLGSHDFVSVGLWDSGVGGGSSSSGGSSGNSSASNAYKGVYYNREEYYYNNVENMANDCSYEVVINNEKLNNISKLIREKNDSYDLTTYNCSNFSTDLWNIADNRSWWSGWFRSPYYVMKDIKGAYSDYSTSNYVESSTWYGHYDTKENMWNKMQK